MQILYANCLNKCLSCANVLNFVLLSPPFLPLFLSVLSLLAVGMHCAEEGHGEDVRHEVHEQTAVHRER